MQPLLAEIKISSAAPSRQVLERFIRCCYRIKPPEELVRYASVEASPRRSTLSHYSSRWTSARADEASRFKPRDLVDQQTSPVKKHRSSFDLWLLHLYISESYNALSFSYYWRCKKKKSQIRTLQINFSKIFLKFRLGLFCIHRSLASWPTTFYYWIVTQGSTFSLGHVKTIMMMYWIDSGNRELMTRPMRRRENTVRLCHKLIFICTILFCRELTEKTIVALWLKL